MENEETVSQDQAIPEQDNKPGLLSRLIHSAQRVYHNWKCSYFIEIAIVTPATPEQKQQYGPRFGGTLTAKKFIVYKQDVGETDFVNEAKDATCFDYILGSTVVHKLRKEFKDFPNTKISMVPINDQEFIDAIVKGPADTNSTPIEEKPNTPNEE